MKILAVGDSLRINTGYGIVNRYLLSHFASSGHDVIQIGIGHTEPSERIIIDNEGHYLQLYPSYMGGEFCETTVKYVIAQWAPDVYFNCNDYFSAFYMPQFKQDLLRSAGQAPIWLHYGIVDGPDTISTYRSIIESIDKPVVATQYAYNQVIKHNPRAEVIPHGYDGQFFYRRDDDTIIKLKRSLGISDRFVIGAANRNIGRKNFPLMLKAYAEFKKEEKASDALLFMLCDPHDPSGYDLSIWMRKFGLKFTNNPALVDSKTDVLFHPKYINAIQNLTTIELAESFNTFDIHFSTSDAEGFGLTTLETMACGIPNIILDNTANTELVQNRGWLYSRIKYMDGSDALFPGSGYTPYLREAGDMYSAKLSLIDAYSHRNKIDKYRQACLNFVKNMTWNNTFESWTKILDKCEATII